MWQAILNFFRGLIFTGIEASAEANPEIHIQGMIQKRLGQRAELRRRAGQLRGRIKTQRAELAQKDNELKAAKLALERAVAANNRKVGTALQNQIKALEPQVEQYKRQLEQLENVEQNIIEDIRRYDQKIKADQTNLKTMAAQVKSAELQKSLIDQLNGLAFEASQGTSEVTEEASGKTA